MNEEFNNKENTNEVNDVNNVENIASTDINVVEQSNENIEESNVNINKDKNSSIPLIIMFIVLLLFVFVFLGGGNNLFSSNDKQEQNNNSIEDKEENKDNTIVEDNKDDGVKYETIEFGMKVYKKGGKYGLLSNDGDILTEAKYDNLENHLSYIIYRINEKYGLLNDDGKELTIAKYDMLKDANSKLLYYVIDKKYGLLNIGGKELTIDKYDYLEYEETGIYKYKLNEKYGLISENGKELTLPKYNKISCEYDWEFSEIKCKTNGEEFYVKNETIVNKEDTLIINDNYVIDGKKYILYSKNDKMGLMDENKNIIIDAKYDGVYYLLNGVLGHSSYTIMHWKNDTNGNPMFLAGRDNSYVLIKNNEEKVIYKEKDNLKNPYQIGKIGDYIVLHTADSVKVIDENLNVIIENGIYSDIFTYSWNDNTVVAYDGNKTYEFDINLKLKNTYDEKGKIAHKSGMGPTDVTSFSNYIIGVEKDYMSESNLYEIRKLGYSIVTKSKNVMSLYKDGKEILTCDSCEIELQENDEYETIGIEVKYYNDTKETFDINGNKLN